jgi:aspartyl-tRNA(Asn)/glutamyl-tRNA(Gln) amidotransferase subunit C
VSVDRDEVLRVARLAELAVPESEVDQLVAQFNRILDYVAQLEAAPGGGAAAYGAGPPAAPVREDIERSAPLDRPAAEIAPESADGFFLVPRHGAMEDH